MPEKSEKKSIELLPPKKFEEYPLSKKLTTWIINVGRIIIITTELVAFSVFIGRIKLDRNLTDLTDALENQIVILKNVESFERDFRDLQQRLQTIKELRESQVPTGKIISLLSSLLPQNVTLTGLTLNKDESYFLSEAKNARFSSEARDSYLIAKTSSATAFAQAIHRLKNSPKIKEIALTSGRFSAKDGSYHFSLAIKFVEEGF